MAPPAPVLLDESHCDRIGLMVKWIAPNNKIDSFTLSWKAESWWQSSTETVDGSLTEYLITKLPANEKVKVSLYATDKAGSSGWSNEQTFITSRDCGLEGDATPDIRAEIALPAETLYEIMYTKEYDQYATEVGLVTNIECLEYEEKEDGIHKRVRVTPPCPPSIKSMLDKALGQALTYEEVSVKAKDKMEIQFKIQNIPVVDAYAQASGQLALIPVDANSCRLEGFFDLRCDYPVIGYYVAQVIKQQVVRDLSEWPTHATKYIESKK